MRNSVRMHSSKSSAVPRRICAQRDLETASAISCGSWRRVRRAKSASASAVGAARVERRQNVLDPVAGEQTRRSRCAARVDRRPPRPAARRRPSTASTGTAPHSASTSSGNRADGDPVGGDAGGHGIVGIEPLAGERAIGAELARQARQEPGRTDVGKEADADLRHREHEACRRRRDASRAPRCRRRRP